MIKEDGVLLYYKKRKQPTGPEQTITKNWSKTKTWILQSANSTI